MRFSALSLRLVLPCLLALAGLSLPAPTHARSWVNLAQSQPETRFTVGQTVVVQLNDGYYLATVDRVYASNGFTMIDYRWTRRVGNEVWSGSGSTAPAYFRNVLTLEQARSRSIAPVNGTLSAPAAIANRPTSTPTPSPSPRPASSTNPPAAPAQGMAAELLAAHNRYRADAGVPALAWSSTLARDAQQWATHLASLGGNQLVHSSNAQRPGQGENLWLGTADRFTYANMVEGWGSERQYFQAGTFPNVSSTGNWADVGHYTQIVWRGTREVGCATARAGGNDILVCRYSPPGNYSGQRVY